MTPATFRTAGKCLYGPRWHSSLAEALGVNRRTIRRWASGEYPVPSEIEDMLRLALCHRRAVIGELLGP